MDGRNAQHSWNCPKFQDVDVLPGFLSGSSPLRQVLTHVGATSDEHICDDFRPCEEWKEGYPNADLTWVHPPLEGGKKLWGMQSVGCTGE